MTRDPTFDGKTAEQIVADAWNIRDEVVRRIVAGHRHIAIEHKRLERLEQMLADLDQAMRGHVEGPYE